MGEIILLTDENASFDSVMTKEERGIEEIGQLLQILQRKNNEFAVKVNNVELSISKAWDKIEVHETAFNRFQSIVEDLYNKIDSLEKEIETLKNKLEN